MSDADGFDYHVVDVFTDRAFAGNPLAVVVDADALSDVQMQAIASEFNLSETTFVVATSTAEATYRVRIFTPSTELPFAGHPSVGTAWLLARLGRIPTGPVVQECGAGLVRLVVDEAGAELTGSTPTQSDVVDPEPFLRTAGLGADDLVGTPVRMCGAGLDWAFLHVQDGSLSRIVLDLGALGELPGAGVSVFSYVDGTAHARVFAGGVGVPEDPATGSAALGLGVYLVASGLVPGDATSSYEVSQGAEIGRPSRLLGHVEARDGRAVEVRVSGGVKAVAQGRISPPPA